jgi:hypothetical protein
VRVFLYSRQQEAVAGTDGEQTFNRVFGEEARIVVVLYRAGWGQTPFTRIEETAIRNRAFDQGYDFALFIPLDPSPTVPAWLPKNRIWIGLERWGEHAAASVIEARVQEAGGEPRQETAADSARRLARDLAAAQRRRGLNRGLSVDLVGQPLLFGNPPHRILSRFEGDAMFRWRREGVKGPIQWW